MTADELFALDVRMAETVMGWKVFSLEQGLHDGNTPRPHCLRVLVPDGTEALKVFDVNGNIRWWAPSRNIADAWEVVEKAQSTTPWRLELWWSDDRQAWKCKCGQCRHYTATNAAEAICLAIAYQTAPAAQPGGGDVQ